MLSNIGIPGLILILVLALILFGPSKLPEVGKALGRTFREFKDATKGLLTDEEPAKLPDGQKSAADVHTQQVGEIVSSPTKMEESTASATAIRSVK